MHLRMQAILVLAFICGLAMGNHVKQERIMKLGMQVVQGFNDLAFTILRELGTGNKENIITSSLSAAYTLGMLELGAGSDTRKEIQQALGHPDLTLEDLRCIYKCMTTGINKVAGNGTLQLANALFCEDKFWIIEQWEKNITDLFGADLAFVDFAHNADMVTQRMNTWVSNKTRGQITSLFDKPLNSSTVVMLINAITYQSNWKNAFDRTFTAPFYGAQWTQQVPMMYKTAVMNFATDNVLGLHAVEIPLIDNTLSMVLMVPKDHSSCLSTLERQLSASQLNRILDLMKPRNVSVSLPKFTFSQSYTLDNILKNLGVRLIFKKGADISAINDTTTAFVSQVLQKVKVDINEGGVQGVAASGLGIEDRQDMTDAATPSNVMTVLANHPFMFIIKCKGGLIFFAGRANDPTRFGY